MVVSRGYTLVEMLVVIVIIGIIAAVAIPSYYSSIWLTNAQGVENNLRAIAGAEQKYYEDHAAYYTSAGNPDTNISSNLSLNMGMVKNGFTYYCSLPGGLLNCTASNASTPPSGQPNSISIDHNGTLTCTRVGLTVNCP